MRAAWLISVFILVTSCRLFAQTQVTPESRAAATDAVYDLLQKYQKYCTFRELGETTISEDAIGNLLALFDTSAVVRDEINPMNIPTGDFSMQNKPVKKYVDDVRTNYPKGLTVRITKATISFDSLGKGMVYVAIEKEISASNKDAQSLVSKDTLQLDIKVTNDTTASIVGIESLGGQMTCSNCPKPIAAATPKKTTTTTDVATVEKKSKKKAPPADVVVIDNKPKKASTSVVVVEKKEKPSKGKPFFAFSAILDGPLTIMKMGSPDATKFNYNNLIADKSYITNFSSGSPAGSVSASLMADLVIPTRKKITIGIGLGLMYNFSSTKAKADSIHLQYEATDNEGTNYMRIFDAAGVTEKVKNSSIGIPLLLKLQTDTSKKVGFFIHAGPVFFVYNSVTSAASGTMDHEAVYQNRNGAFTYDPTGTIESTDWVITNAFVSEHATSISPNSHYEQTYAVEDVAFNQTINGKQKFTFNTGIGGILRGGVAINTSPKVAVLIGLELMYVSVSGNKQYGAPLYDNLGNYNSMLYAINQYSIFNYGITLGLQYKFIKVKH